MGHATAKHHSSQERKTVAIHESGHVIVGLMLDSADKIDKVTIVSLCISLILFMTFGTIIKQLINELNSQERTPGYQIYLYLPYSKHQESILNQISHLEEIDDIYQKQKVFYYDDQIDPDENEKGNLIGIVQVEDEVYEVYKKELAIVAFH